MTQLAAGAIAPAAMGAASMFPGLAMATSPSASPAQVPLLIDSHVHVWKRDPAFPFSPDRKPPTEDATAEMLLELMQANGVARTVLIQMIHYKWDNSYLASVLQRYPQHFAGVCRVNPEDPAAPDTLAQLVEEQGFQGVRLSPYTAPEYDWIKGPLMPPLWARTSELKVPMTVLTEAPRLPQLVPLIEANPELTVVIDHMADVTPDNAQGVADLLALARYPRVFVKISHPWKIASTPYPYPDAMDLVKKLYDTYGANRLMWGTDWPIAKDKVSYPDIIRLYRDHLDFMTPQDREQVLGKTVQEVWPFGL